MNNKLIIVLAIIIIIASGAGFYVWHKSNDAKMEAANRSEVQNIVENFGQVLKNVSLLSPTW